ncbi:fumarylacetoacetate hydrolase family protein [Sagittula salina]|uniref:Fumarylacetoacetate hydrolase family protein n=1 Tax=Sagittula salina TaxID=2820268 RepID=A0A940MY25_9RHOB|nr:fumarylacetoacetate hydrolase family protein [Sagittula salina]MBP0484934.1 fumarylacetoacetate hydrolase family protein [Sagittula salina]
MRIVTVQRGEDQLVAIEAPQGVIPLADLPGDLPATALDVVRGGPDALQRIRDALDATDTAPLAPGSFRLLAPIPRPAKNIVCVGKNYVEHAREFQGSGFDSSSGGQEVPDLPIIFTKAPTSVVGPGADVIASHDADGTLDYEGELGVVIGTGGRGITKDRAYDHVFGYTVINDVTARQAQSAHKQWFLGKSCDTFCPMGPAIVTADEAGAVTDLHLTTKVNGELRQDAVVRDLIFDIPTIIETISRAITLEPGDIIATGTPVGVALGFTPPKYLRAGDEVEVEISGIGVLRNRIV